MTPAGERILRILTPVEQQVCVAVCEGNSNKEIAVQLATSVQVVKNHLLRIYRQMQVRTRLDLAVMLFRHGVVECPCGRGGSWREVA